MKNTLKKTATAILLSSVAVVPAATISVVALTDAAYAKSDNAGGNGNGGGNSGGNGGGKSSEAKSKSKSSSSSGGGSSSRSSGGGLGKLLDKITGKDKKVAKSKSTTKPAKASTKSVKVAKQADPMHPSNLGKMNGPLNANVNALIAHVKNGNTNGPIGGMAALAVANYIADGADAIVELEGQFAKLDDLLLIGGYVDGDGLPDVEAYLAAIQDVPGNGSIQSVEDVLNNPDATDQEIADALLGANNGAQDFATVEDYETYRDGVEGDDPIPEADMLIADLEGETRPTEEEIADAEERIGERTGAEDYMLSIWNKGDGDDTMRSEAENDLIEALNARLAADGETLTDAIEEHADLPEEEVAEGDAVCEAAEGCEEEIVAAAE